MVKFHSILRYLSSKWFRRGETAEDTEDGDVNTSVDANDSSHQSSSEGAPEIVRTPLDTEPSTYMLVNTPGQGSTVGYPPKT